MITDIRMPPTGTDEGLRAAERLRAERPEVGVVVLSQYAEPEYALALLEKGASGRAYLLKERVSDIDQLVGAVREVARGGSVIDPRVVEVLVAARSAVRNSPIAQLTPRERDVLQQVAMGKNNAGIAAALFLTERAVEKHINAIFSKLELSEEPDVHRRVKAALVYLAVAALDQSRCSASRAPTRIGHVAHRVLVLAHQLMREADLGERERLRQAGIDLAAARPSALYAAHSCVVGEVRALQALLAHPEIAQVDRGVIPGRARADDHHAAVVADEDRGRDGVLTRMLEDDSRVAAFAEHVPERLAEGASTGGPGGERRVVAPVGDHAPVREVAPVDVAACAEVDAVLAALRTLTSPRSGSLPWPWRSGSPASRGRPSRPRPGRRHSREPCAAATSRACDTRSRRPACTRPPRPS